MKSMTIGTKLFAAAMCLLAVSCTKSKGPQTPLTELENKWKLAEIATDDNGNGVIDNYEIHAVATGTTDVLNFTAGGSGVETVTEAGAPVTYSFSWTMTGDSLRRAGTGHDLVVYYVQLLSSSNLNLQAWIPQGNGASSVLVGYYYKID